MTSSCLYTVGGHYNPLNTRLHIVMIFNRIVHRKMLCLETHSDPTSIVFTHTTTCLSVLAATQNLYSCCILHHVGTKLCQTHKGFWVRLVLCIIYYTLLRCTYCPCYTALFPVTLIHLVTCYIITMYYLLQYLLHLVVDDKPDNSSAASLYSTKVFKCLMDSSCIDRHEWMKMLLVFCLFLSWIHFFLSFFLSNSR